MQTTPTPANAGAAVPSLPTAGPSQGGNRPLGGQQVDNVDAVWGPPPPTAGPSQSSGGSLLPLPAFVDNYIWLLRYQNLAAVVDPGDAKPVLHALAEGGLRLHAILLTHHHHDHVGGVLELSQLTGAVVYGPATENLPRCDFPLKDGNRVQLAELDLNLDILDVPGHTAGHIAYFGRAAGVEPVLFCGDTLFAGGCGRLFEGTPTQMAKSLVRFAELSIDTQVCCAHEYTLNNLRWALTVDPANRILQQWYQRAQRLREQGYPTLPSTIGLERDTNPFLRTQQVEIAEAAEAWAGRPLTSSVEVLAVLREWKNNFK